MKLSTDQLKNIWREETRRKKQLGSCPDGAFLARAAIEDLVEQERERLINHLAICADCADEYRLLRSLHPWAEQMAAQTEAAPLPKNPETAASASLSGYTLRQPARDFSWWRVLANSFTPLPAPYVAAAMTVACLIVGFWAISLRLENRRLQGLEGTLDQQVQLVNEARQQALGVSRRAGEQETRIAAMNKAIDSLTEPQLNVPIIDLAPRGLVRGSSQSGVKILNVAPAAQSVTFVLNVEGEPGFPEYSLEIIDSQQRPLWHGEGLKKSEYNNFTVMLPRHWLPDGLHRLRIYGHANGHKQLVEDYIFRVVGGK